MNALLYGLTVLIWGTTWLAIKWQLGVVPPPVSIAYRFGIASLVLFAVLLVMRRRIWPPTRAWPYLVAQGVALFCCNFLCFYYAERTVPSGMVAVIFSLAPVLNSINGRLFLGRRLQPAVVAGSMIGLVGIVCLFMPQLMQSLHGQGSLGGLLVALLGTVCFSTGKPVVEPHAGDRARAAADQQLGDADRRGRAGARQRARRTVVPHSNRVRAMSARCSISRFPAR